MRLLLAFALALVVGSPLLAACGGSDSTAIDCSDASRVAPKSGSLPFGEGCCADAECDTGTCADFSQKGTLCSKTCAGDADCAGLGTSHCGGMGTCQVSE